MFYDQRQVNTPQHTQTTNVSAKLIASITILQLSSLELEQAISVEQAENPAFEVDEVPQCLQCGTPLRGGMCQICGGNALAAQTRDTTAEWDNAYEPTATSNSADEDDFDPMSRVSTTASLEESLLSTMRTLLPDEDMFIAEALVGNLDSHGYLTASIQELTEDLDVSAERVENVLALLQAQEPLGIGARDLSECLLIQLHWFREQGQPQPLAEQIVGRFLKDVGERRFVEIGRELGTTSTHIKRAWQFIKANLNPYPAHAALDGETTRGSRATAALVRPDVIIRRTDSGFEAEVVEGKRFKFGIQSSYNMAARLKDPVSISDSERKHIRQYVQRAQFFIDCVQQRWMTLKKIADALIEDQYEFLDNGVRYLKPLTRSELAIHVGLHEATISRATNDKYVLLPDGRTIPFDDFFDASLRAKDTLRELIADEDVRHPLSDEDLAEMLTDRGMPVARRTVAKYRESLKILPSRLR